VKPIQVESYAGYKGEQEPRVIWLDDGPHAVAGIGDRWYDPRYDAFRVRTADGLSLLVQRDRADDQWYLVKLEALDA
jgi:hypothetical protein